MTQVLGIFFLKGAKVIKNDARTREIENVNNCMITHPTKEKSESVKNIVNLVKSIRTF